MLTVMGLSVRYGASVAVADVDMTLPDGEIVALLGPSGCGKSSLLRAIAGIEPVAAGAVYWDGVDVSRVPVHRRGFGLMFQEGALFPHRTVAGNIGYGLRGHAAIRPRVTELLEMVGLPDAGDRRVTTLSGGEAQRVALARALAPRPRLLLLDEPLAALDRALREQLLVDLRSVLRRTRTTALFVTHDQNEAFAIADTIAVMRAGRIVQSGARQEVWTRPRDVETARFLGCSTILDAAPVGRDDGSPEIRTRLGNFPGRATAIGLRPAALIVDAAGSLTGEVVSTLPGPERQQVGVKTMGTVTGGDSEPANEINAQDGVLEPFTVQAIAAPGRCLAVGQPVRLRCDTDQVAMIGGGPEVAAPVGARMVVAGAVIVDRRLLVARRSAPPHLAGLWELPGGKVEPGETEPDALVRELAEELDIVVDVAERVGPAVDLGPASDGSPRRLQVYRASLRSGTPSLAVHDSLRWVGPGDLAGLDWVPADRELVPHLVSLPGLTVPP